MPDSRIINLTDEVLSSEIQALLDEICFAVDHTSFTDAAKLKLSEFLITSVIDSNANNFQAMTPKSFYDSVMTSLRYGIGIFAEDAAVTSKTGIGLLNTAHQVLMQAQWIKDWFTAKGTGEHIPPTYYKNENFGTSMSAISFPVNFVTTLSGSQLYNMGPDLTGTGKRYQSVYFSIVVKRHLVNAFFSDTKRLDSIFSGINTTEISTGSNIFLQIDNDTLRLYIGSLQTVSDYTVSAQMNCILV